MNKYKSCLDKNQSTEWLKKTSQWLGVNCELSTMPNNILFAKLVLLWGCITGEVNTMWYYFQTWGSCSVGRVGHGSPKILFQWATIGPTNN